MRNKFLSIKEKGGLELYLKSLGIDYLKFVELHRKGVNPTNMGKVFNKDYRTINHWVSVHEKELKNAKKR